MNLDRLRSAWALCRVEGWLAWRNVLRHRRRSAFSVGSVAVGVVALVFASGFIEWTLWALRESTIQSRLGHIQIARPGFFKSGAARPFDFLLPASSPEQRHAEELPGVRAVAARLSFSGLISRGETTLSFLGEGMDPEREQELSAQVVIEEGESLATDDPQGIIVGRGLADNLGVRASDQVVLVANTPTGGINAVEVHVKGLFSTATKAYDDSAIRVVLPLAQKLLRTAGAHIWVVALDDTDRTDGIVRALRKQLPGAEFQVTPWYELADFYNKTVGLFSRQLVVVKVIIGALIVLIISNSLSMSVMERTGEIGTSLALGVRRMRLLRQFVMEGLFLGLIGGIIGILLGIAVARAASKVGIPMPPPPGMARGFVGEVRLTAWLLFDAMFLALLTAVVASLYPAWKGSRLVIVDALRQNR
jgi:putative ABC transport system permease protein